MSQRYSSSHSSSSSGRQYSQSSSARPSHLQPSGQFNPYGRQQPPRYAQPSHLQQMPPQYPRVPNYNPDDLNVPSQGRVNPLGDRPQSMSRHDYQQFRQPPRSSSNFGSQSQGFPPHSQGFPPHSQPMHRSPTPGAFRGGYQPYRVAGSIRAPSSPAFNSPQRRSSSQGGSYGGGGGGGSSGWPSGFDPNVPYN